MADPEILTFSVAIITLFIAWIQIKFQGSQQNLFQEHYTIVQIDIGALVMLWCLFGIKVKCPGVYQAYARYLPFDLEFCAFLSIASTGSLMLPESLKPLVVFLYLIPSVKILYWVFNKLEDAFEDRQFWAERVDPVLCYLERKKKKAFRRLGLDPLLPLYKS